MAYGVRHRNLFSGFCIFLAFAILVLFGGTRDLVGTDFQTYANIYASNASLSWPEYFSQVTSDVLFYLIARVIYLLGGNLYIVNSVIALLTLIPAFAFIRNNKDIFSLGIAFFTYFIFYYAYSFNGMRQYVAIAITLWAIKFVLENRFKEYVFAIVLAMTFHTSSVAAFPIWFFWNHLDDKPCGDIKIMLLVVIGLTGVFLLAPYVLRLLSSAVPVFERYLGYLEPNNLGENKEFFLMVIEFAAFLVCRPKLKRKNRYTDFYFPIGIVMIVALGLGFSNSYLKRIGLYYQLPFRTFLFSAAAQSFQARERMVVNVIIIVYSIAYFIMSAYVLGQSDLVPYQSVLSMLF